MVFGDLGRNRSAKKLAAEHHLVLDTDTTAPPRLSVLSGQDSKVTRTLQRPGAPCRVFDFQRSRLEQGHDDEFEKKIDRYTCALIELPFAAPQTLFGRESVTTKLTGRVGGARDIKIGHAAFDRRYTVRTLDEEFLRELMTEQTIAWFMFGDTVGSTEFELRSGYLVARSKRRPISDYPAILDWAAEFVTLVPPMLIDRYP